MYALIRDGKVNKYPYTIENLKRDNPCTSFPKGVSDELLESYGVLKVQPTPVPAFDPKTESISHNISKVDGVWVQNYTVGRLDEKSAAANIRAERNHRLADCDWTQLGDSPLNADYKLAWALYRETLRMIPQQEGFPYNVTWPPKPQ